MGIFGGKTESTTPAVAAAPPRDRHEAAPIAATGAQAPTIIGKDAFIKGELRSNSDMLVEGKVEGEIHGTRVVIGESGDVQARVFAQVLTVRGVVRGDCEASQKVEITATGKVFGNITSRAIVVDEGATFRGASKMAHPDTHKPEPSRSDPPPKGGAGTPSAGPVTTASTTSPS